MADQNDDQPSDDTAEINTAEINSVTLPTAPPADVDEEDYLPQPPRRVGRLTVALLAALIAGLGVLGGVQIERMAGGQGSVGSGTAAPVPSGAGFPGGASQGSGRRGPPGAGDQGQMQPGSPTSSDSANGSAQVAVVGTVAAVHESAVTVTDLGKSKHEVKITSSTTVTNPYRRGALRAGDTVAVTGSTASDRSITATNITVR
ncbi:MAG TPA: DUF5666 domain-containing protein [Propionibacteriaceae bacterium]